MTNKIIKIFENIFTFLEKKRFNILTLFIWIFILSAVRMWTEAYLFNYPYQEISFKYFFTHLHIISFYFTVFLGGVLIIKFFSKQKLSKITNLTGIGFIIILFPPLIDKFIFNRTDVYTYIPPDRLIEAFSTFFTGLGFSVGGYGLAFELISIVLLTTLYVFIKTKSIKKTALNFIAFYFFIPLIATPNLNPIISNWSVSEIAQPIFILRYLILSAIIILLTVYSINKEFFKSLIKTCRPITSFHFALMAFIGILFANLLFPISEISSEGFFIDLFTTDMFVGSIGTFGISLFIMVFLWQYTIMLNHIYDFEIDKISNKDRLLPQGYLTKKQITQIAIIFALISLGLAFILNLQIFILSLFALIIGTLYSIPPIRIRNSIFATTIIGLGSSIGFFIGYFTPKLILNLEFISSGGKMVPISTLIFETPEITTEAILVGIVLFIILSIGPLLTDLKDYEGDKKSKVKSIYTVYGKEKGIKISSIMLLIAFFSPLIVFNNIIFDYILFIPLGIIAAFIFYKYNKPQPIFILYLPMLIYCIIRWLSFI